MGTRLRNLRKEMKGKLFSDEINCKRKGLGGAGRLSYKNINIIQNSNSVFSMKKQ